ncbi:MAG: ATP-dependent DNA helicase [Fimbriimonadaceae bacterium]|nr:ATP-dependent DNA helicase [Fimbriimonadaceae bacterium]
MPDADNPSAADAIALIERAFDELRMRSGFSERPAQRQLSLLLADLIAYGQTGAFEAPTGLGKSLAVLIPAIAHAIASNRRTVIATYTNVLAEQYWQKDLPFALSLFDQEVSCAFLLGRQRYACRMELPGALGKDADYAESVLQLGTENEFRKLIGGRARGQGKFAELWSRVQVPAVCEGRRCPKFKTCYFYGARALEETAAIVITNHSVVITDAQMATLEERAERDGLLGKYDFLILDEAHDFVSAAENGLEIEINAGKLNMAAGLAARIEASMRDAAREHAAEDLWMQRSQRFRDAFIHLANSFAAPTVSTVEPGILAAAPKDLTDHAAVQRIFRAEAVPPNLELTTQVARVCRNYTRLVSDMLTEYKPSDAETIRAYLRPVTSLGEGAEAFFADEGVAVSHFGQRGRGEQFLRRDTVGLAEPLRHLIWDRVPYACVSATLSLDGGTEYFRRSLGMTPTFEEILPSPFDYGTHAAVYLPPTGRIPDPTAARRDGLEPLYFAAIAAELRELIMLCGGRTLALFHSRREMEEVYGHLQLPDEYPVLMQPLTGAASTGERFKREPQTSLFALRTFWTGFDAPGETLSCVALVRIPFEVPTEPLSIARSAYLAQQGLDPFREHALAQAKMLVRQGAGRLLRTTDDRGIIAILDPRVRTKPYGADILANLPPEMREFDDASEAVAWALPDLASSAEGR